MFRPVSTARLWRLCAERIDASHLPGIRMQRIRAPAGYGGEHELAPCFGRDQPRPRFDAPAHQDVFPHHAPITAACPLRHPAVVQKMLCTKPKIITLLPGPSAAARTGNERGLAAEPFTQKKEIFMATHEL